MGSLNKAKARYSGIYLENKELLARFQIQNGNAFMATKQRQIGILLAGCLARTLILKSANLDSSSTGYLLESFILPKHLFSDLKRGTSLHTHHAHCLEVQMGKSL